MKKVPDSSVRVLADEVLDGGSFALTEYRRDPHSSAAISLEVRDTERDSAAAVRCVRELAADPDVVAVVGPLFSNIAIACASVADSARLPMVSPTATANGLAGKWTHMFQANPDFAARGKAMARFSVRQLGLTSFAVLSSREPMGKSVAESFSEEARRLGAAVITEQFFDRGSSDLRDQFMKIREEAFKPGAQIGDLEDLKVPVTSIQGMFVALADPEEIGVVAPQVSYFNIKTQLLGSAEWNAPAELEAHKRYVNGIIFLSDFFVADDDSIYREFKSTFSTEMKKQPTRYTLYGYDTMKLILAEIEAGSRTRETLTAALSSVKGYRGLHSRMTLANGRVNSELFILKYKNGEITKEQELSVQ